MRIRSGQPPTHPANRVALIRLDAETHPCVSSYRHPFHPAWVSCNAGLSPSGQNIVSMPSSHCSWFRQHRLWQTSLHRTSLTIPTSDLHRTLSPNFRLTMLNVLSTLLRLW